MYRLAMMIDAIVAKTIVPCLKERLILRKCKTVFRKPWVRARVRTNWGGFSRGKSTFSVATLS